MKILSIFLLLFSGAYLSAAPGSVELETLKLDKRFGIGIAAAGGYSILGIEADVNLTENLSVSGGVGTGIDYSTMAVKIRHFLLGKWVSPYAAVGLARWWTDSTKQTNISPSVLATKFLPENYDLSKGFDVWLMTPALGVQFMHPMGLAFNLEVQYLFRLFSMSGGAYAGMGVHWYF